MAAILSQPQCVNKLATRHIGRRDDIFKCVFFNKNVSFFFDSNNSAIYLCIAKHIIDDSYYIGHSLIRPLTPYGVTEPQSAK